ncbi:MAG TPA: NAD(P)-binding protein, partial [Candidatus Nanoarchaeia archaeon]|nr:NAD(P)-binding protein [Candidatus Nanoarchaeia archaeon]
ISEFSLILINLGLKVGHLTQEIATLITLVGLITITISTYMIVYNDKLYIFLSRYLTIFERKKLKEERYQVEKNKYELILFGGHRTGYNIIKSLKISKRKFLTVDFNPDVISNLKKQGIEAIYGDVSDQDFIEELLKIKPKIVISTIHNLEDNLEIIKTFRKFNKNGLVFVTTRDLMELKTLYEKGADFVILPELLTGQKIADYISHLDKKSIKKWGKYYYKSISNEIKAGLV